MRWVHARGALDCSRGHLIGILNATPDSFTDRGAHWGTERSVAHGIRLARQGAAVVEVGGESLQAGTPLDPEEEIARVVPVVARLVREIAVPIAVDTFKAPVAAAALAAGASIVNDPTGFAWDPDMARVVASAGAGVVVSHYFGRPKEHPASFPEVDVPRAIVEWGRERLAACAAAGIEPERVVVDPGVGLGTSPPQDLDLLRRLEELAEIGRPVFVPISNKKVIGAVTGLPPKRRLSGTAAALVWCRAHGASLFRVHNVRFLHPVLAMAEALVSGAPERWHQMVD